MRTRCLLVAAALCACGGDAVSAAKDAGTDASKAKYERDAGHPERDAGHDSGKPAAQGGKGGSAEPDEAGSGGQVNLPTGGMVAGGTGGGPDPQPEGGKGGSQPEGGSQAPVEHVLWSQDWTVTVHDAVAYGAAEGDTMGLSLDAGQGCRFGTTGAPSGSTQTYDTDGRCITAFGLPAGLANFFSLDGQTSGNLGRAPLMGWKEAVTGHTVTGLRRTQTYTIQLLGSDNQTWNYADFTGRWEAVGF